MVDRPTLRVEELLARRPITEEIAMTVLATPGYEHLEIRNGEWVGLNRMKDETMAGEAHGWLESLLFLSIGNFVVAHRLGRIYPGDVRFVLDGEPGDIRVQVEPDIAFVASDRITPTEGYIYRAPDLAVEIVSPSQSYEEMAAKIDDYLRFGTKQVWLVLPTKKRIEVHTADNPPAKYGVGQTVSGGDVLPGFTLDVAKVFGD